MLAVSKFQYSYIKSTGNMLKCLSKNLMLPLFIPLAISLPTWWGDRRSIMFSLAHLFSVSAPDDAPTNKLYLSFPWRPFFST